jgi:hypothetical protein
MVFGSGALDARGQLDALQRRVQTLEETKQLEPGNKK